MSQNRFNVILAYCRALDYRSEYLFQPIEDFCLTNDERPYNDHLWIELIQESGLDFMTVILTRFRESDRKKEARPKVH